MKKILPLLAIWLVFTQAYSQQQAALPLSSYGIWDRGDKFLADPTNPVYSFYRGTQVALRWADIQPTNSLTLNWTVFDAQLQVCANHNKNVYINIFVGPDSPAWVYTNGVPKVMTDATTQFNGTFPYYLSDSYIQYYHYLISEFGKHIRNLEPALRSRVTFVQVMTGCTGDEVAYKGNPLTDYTQYAISSTEWLDFRLAAFGKFKAAFLDGDQSTRIPLLFNNIDPDNGDEVEWNWVIDSVGSNFGFKGSAYVRGHHLTEELRFKNTWNQYQINPKGMVLFSRAEMDQSCTKTMYNLNPKIGFYWGILSGLNTGLSVHDLSANATELALGDPDIMASILFFNKYAGQIFPGTATAAYSVFHEGLNSANTTKFPDGKYGPSNQSNTDRYTAICTEYAGRGAKMDDLIAATKGQVYQRDKQTGYNDAGWEIEEGNYERWIYQIRADSTSIGLFRVRGTITTSSSKYDRFARSFEHSSGKDTMFFKFHNEAFSSTNKPESLQFSVTWLDSIAGSTWEFRYKNTNGILQSPLKITGLGDKTWKTVTTTITDMDVTQAGTLGSDFMLVNTDNTDDIFNGIEVDIERGAFTGLKDKSDDNNSFQLFPNPAKSVLNWNINTNTDRARIYSINGVLLLQSTILNSKSIDVSHLNSGMYFLQFCKGNRVIHTAKFIKE